ncbi:hypothetical protein MMC25_005713 [Agyrium rufum]|nr:hypothetical protein [Agyrium rufum]
MDDKIDLLHRIAQLPNELQDMILLEFLDVSFDKGKVRPVKLLPKEDRFPAPYDTPSNLEDIEFFHGCYKNRLWEAPNTELLKILPTGRWRSAAETILLEKNVWVVVPDERDFREIPSISGDSDASQQRRRPPVPPSIWDALNPVQLGLIRSVEIYWNVQDYKDTSGVQHLRSGFDFEQDLWFYRTQKAWENAFEAIPALPSCRRLRIDFCDAHNVYAHFSVLGINLNRITEWPLLAASRTAVLEAEICAWNKAVCEEIENRYDTDDTPENKHTTYVTLCEQCGYDPEVKELPMWAIRLPHTQSLDYPLYHGTQTDY